MLDIDRRPDVDAVAEQFLDILEAFRMAAVRRIGMGEFVDDDDRRAPGESGIKIELLDDPPVIIDLAARKDFEVLQQFGGFRPAMRLDEADDD